MTATKISNLPAVATPEFTDEFAIVDISADETKKATLGIVRAKPTYSWANLPDVGTYQWQLIIVSDNVNSPLAYSDGADWRYVSDGSLVRMEDIRSGSLVIITMAPSAIVDLTIEVPITSLVLTTTAPTVV